MTSDLSRWTARENPGQSSLVGTSTLIEPFSAKLHGDELFAAVAGDGNAELWAYIPSGPYDDVSSFLGFLAVAESKLGWRVMVIRNKASGEILGMFSIMRIRSQEGSAEVGFVLFGPRLKRSTIATEALFLLASHLFDELGYRRFEWKCDNGNLASKRAAERFGFLYEGLFRNDMVVKGRNRDTAWYAMTCEDWPGIKNRYTRWLSPENFSADGGQRVKLADML